MTKNALASESAAIVATVDPDALVFSPGGTYDSDWVDASLFHRYLVALLVGTLGSGATIDVQLYQAKDASGTGAKEITGKTITALTQASPDGSDKQAVINLRPEELDVDNDFSHFRATITVTVANSDAGLLILGLDPRYGPADDHDLASVAEIVA